MKYYKNNKTNDVYAYLKGVTVVWDKQTKKWQLSSLNVINLGFDENVQEITEDKALKIAEKNPQDKIYNYLNYLKANATKDI